MKKLFFIFSFLIVSNFCFAQIVNGSLNIYHFTLKNNFLWGEEEGEIFSYTLYDINTSYKLQLYHFLPSLGDDDNIKGTYKENGYVNFNGTLLLKLSNDSILNITYYNTKCKYYDYDISNSGYKYYIMTCIINKDDFLNIINIGVKKIRIETNSAYIELKSNIFSKISEGYNNIEKQKYDINNKKSIYNNF